MSCLVRQAEASVNEFEDQRTGEGFAKWVKCFDCGQDFHGAVKLALGWACWKTYLGRPDTDGVRCISMGALGNGLREWRPNEALPVLEAELSLLRRYWSHDEKATINTQSNLASCLADLERHDEALVLHREIYARAVAALGVSHKYAIMSGSNVAQNLFMLRHFDEAAALLRDQLLPVARQSLGADSDVILKLNQTLSVTLADNPESTRDHLR